MNDHRFADVEKGDLGGGTTAGRFDPGMRLKKPDMAQDIFTVFFGLEIRLNVRSEEVPDLVAFLHVGIDLAVPDLGALADHELLALGPDLEHAAFGDFKGTGLGDGGTAPGKCRGAGAVPDVVGNPSHPGVEVDGDRFRGFLDDGKCGQEAARREFMGDHEAFGGFVEIDAVMEQLELNDFPCQRRAGGCDHLRDDGGREQKVFAQRSGGDHYVLVGGWSQSRGVFCRHRFRGGFSSSGDLQCENGAHCEGDPAGDGVRHRTSE